MSTIESEDLVVAPWVGPTCCKNCYSFVVLSFNYDMIDKISSALTEAHSKGSHRWKLILLRANNLEKLVRMMRRTENVALDFIIIALDTTKVFVLEWAKQVLLQVHPDLRRRRVILVNGSGLPVYSMAIEAEELLSLQDDFNLDMVSANVFNNEDATYLAQRLLKYFEVSVGAATGIPNLNI
ncbi:hypothetical protein JYU34_013406 [Plutella xylostella]|uniref:Centromere protein M n=1 Tax=Plutella xylostella TaxID=51655 RepID=A0ABQ7Q9P6_PLUXY|nr:hypothetical protein JYU34_013406 [Plutella xylostella]